MAEAILREHKQVRKAMLKELTLHSTSRHGMSSPHCILHAIHVFVYLFATEVQPIKQQQSLERKWQM